MPRGRTLRVTDVNLCAAVEYCMLSVLLIYSVLTVLCYLFIAAVMSCRVSVHVFLCFALFLFVQVVNASAKRLKCSEVCTELKD